MKAQARNERKPRLRGSVSSAGSITDSASTGARRASRSCATRYADSGAC